MNEFKLRQGYDIRLVGEPAPEIVNAPVPKAVAVKPSDFRGIKPKLLVEEGARVRLGAALFHAQVNPEHLFTSPATGVVREIKRGARRVVEQIVIQTEADDGGVEFQSYSPERLRSLSRDEVLSQVRQSGSINLFRQRPFDYVADPNVVPRDIFVSTFDTAPLAPDLNLIVKGNESYFQAGLDVASRLTSGKVYLSLDGRRANGSTAFTQARNVQICRFTGRHPAGCVGVQIHHLAPINGRQDIVWYCTVPGLIQIGKLFLTGRLANDVVIAVAGSAATERKYFRTRIGAGIDTIVDGRVESGPLRYIAGNVLTGRKVDGNSYIGYYDSLITVLPEATEPEFVGWMMPGVKRQSYYRAYLSGFFRGKKFVRDTKLNGGRRAFILAGNYEQVLPMRLYPTFLLKSILAGDIEEMEALGIYEVTEEEMAICEYICPSKIEVQKIVRDGLDMIEREG